MNRINIFTIVFTIELPQSNRSHQSPESGSHHVSPTLGSAKLSPRRHWPSHVAQTTCCAPSWHPHQVAAFQELAHLVRAGKRNTEKGWKKESVEFSRSENVRNMFFCSNCWFQTDNCFFCVFGIVHIKTPKHALMPPFLGAAWNQSAGNRLREHL